MCQGQEETDTAAAGAEEVLIQAIIPALTSQSADLASSLSHNLPRRQIIKMPSSVDTDRPLCLGLACNGHGAQHLIVKLS